MTPDTAILKAVEELGYRVTVGDLAAQAGLELNLAQNGLLALASEAGGHLQVADTGEIVYLFPKNFRNILRNKYLSIRIQEWWSKVWRIIFYLIRISFGIFLMISIAIMVIAITIILSFLSNQDGDNGGDSNGGVRVTWIPNFWWIFDPSYDSNYYQRQKYADPDKKSLNFLEAIYSFLFGDGNPNAELDKQRWQTIGNVIRNSKGAIAAEQLAPYLDAVTSDNEDYVLPVLTRFNGYPSVSPTGEIIYYFPELQVSAKQQEKFDVQPYLQEARWKFSEASEGQILGALGLGIVNLGLAVWLGFLFQSDIVSVLGDIITWVHSIYGVLLAYAAGFLGIPFLRYFGVKRRNVGVDKRNLGRRQHAEYLNQSNEVLTNKLKYAQEFAQAKVITEADISYSTEQDLLEQEADNSEKIDREWQRRLES
jgi:hypothetical protein